MSAFDALGIVALALVLALWAVVLALVSWVLRQQRPPSMPSDVARAPVLEGIEYDQAAERVVLMRDARSDGVLPFPRRGDDPDGAA